MSAQKKIWNYLNINSITNKLELCNKLNISKDSVNAYINALYKANYIIFCSSTKRPNKTDLFKLIEKTGYIYPLFSHGCLKDFNIGIEYKLYKENRLESSSTKEKIFKDVLDSFIELNKEEVLISEVSKIFMDKKEVNSKYGSPFLKRWIDKLEEKKLMSFTGSKYRNSKIYLVDLKGIKELRNKLEIVRDYNLVF